MVIYYKKDEKLKYVSIAIISDNLAHDTVAVHEYQKIIVDYLKTHFRPKKIYYFTVDAGQNFKNKNSFANLQGHEEDFGIEAEWHFHGTSHGKGACDGIGANIKRQAARSSLQCSPKHHILTPHALFQWAKSNCKETEIFFSTKKNHALATELLKARFEKAVTIPGTLQYHAFIPTQDGKLQLKKFSFSEKWEIFSNGKKQKPQKRPAKKTTVETIAKKSNRKT